MCMDIVIRAHLRVIAYYIDNFCYENMYRVLQVMLRFVF